MLNELRGIWITSRVNRFDLSALSLSEHFMQKGSNVNES